MILNGLLGAAGLFLVLSVAADVFQSAIVPRPARRWRPSARIFRWGWLLTRSLGLRMRDGERREALFGTFAPLVLVVVLAFWIVALTFGFAAMFFALRTQLRPEPETYWGAAYFAGTSLLTLGFGDITGQSGLARMLSLIAAALGLGTFAIVTAYLFALFAAFQRREAFIVSLRERTGAPPSGVEFLEHSIEGGLTGEISARFREAETWMADLLETHLAYPVLTYMRSTHDGQSYIATIGALLDASALIITTVDIDHLGAAKMLNKLGRHLVVDFANYFRLPLGAVAGIERAEFATAYVRLRSHGYAMHDEEAAWEAFSTLRMTYAAPLNAMAHFYRIPPAQWIGDRSARTRHGMLPPQPLSAGADAPVRIAR